MLHRAEEKDIEIITYPSNATHELQPHNVLAFKTYNDELESLKEKRQPLGVNASKHDFLDMLNTAREKGMRYDIVIESFKKTGIWPIDSTKIP